MKPSTDESGICRLLDFLRRLRVNNNREWFADDKREYLEGKKITSAIADSMIAAVAAVNPEAARLTPADCTYRIYRDTRFSSDKTPYKTHIGIFVNPPLGKKGITCGYYLHLEPDNIFFAAGTIGHPPAVLKAIRQAVFDEIDEYRSIVEDPGFRKLFPTLGDDPLKTAPKGFPKDWPYIGYLRPRNFIASGPVDEALLSSWPLAKVLSPYVEQAFRFNRFMNFTIEDFV